MRDVPAMPPGRPRDSRSGFEHGDCEPAVYRGELDALVAAARDRKPFGQGRRLDQIRTGQRALARAQAGDVRDDGLSACVDQNCFAFNVIFLVRT